MPKFIPLTMLKDTTGIVEFCQECGEPVFVTRNGTPEMVIMDAAFFDEYLRYRTEDGRLDIRKEFAAIPEAITINVRVGRKRPNSVGRKRPIVAA